ncbi:MAG: 3-dehydroquinate synthase [Proteobacteria bacterium]|nr:3-dehydroquinate synthase [Pseudomonadota bacterium]
MAPEKIKLSLGERSYDILVGRDLLANAGEYIKALKLSPKVIIVTDKQVASFHLKTLEMSLDKAGIKHHAIILPAGERTKGFTFLEEVVEEVLDQKPERKSTLIALGGGVMGDLTGFAASIVLRGINFIQIPTTLLAMVDSSVGGKTGINTRHGKNLVGAFYQPKLMIADTSVLSTLPHRQLLAGYAEVLKYGLINDAKFFATLEKEAAKVKDSTVVTGGGEQHLHHMILHSCKAKADIVSADEKEGGVRALLNLGHTFGHALEAETGFSDALLHGEAVALGMVLAFKLSVKLGLCKKADLDRVIEHMKAVGLPYTLSQIGKPMDAKLLLHHMRGDKKVKDGKMVFILARGIGESFIAEDVAEEDVLALLKQAVKE